MIKRLPASAFLFLAVFPILACSLGCPPADTPPGGDPPPSGNSAFGRFEGEVVVRFILEAGDDRTMILEQPFKYVDQNGKSWNVPKGTAINGASIPRALWTAYPPFVGDYRIASVVHDHFCAELVVDENSHDWREVQRMFYNACRCAEMDPATAKGFYAAVYAYWKAWSLKVDWLDKVKSIPTGLAPAWKADEPFPGVALDTFSASPPMFSPLGGSAAALRLAPEVEFVSRLKSVSFSGDATPEDIEKQMDAFVNELAGGSNGP